MANGPWTPLIETWFGDTLADHEAVAERQDWWFSADSDRDQRLAADYGDLLEDCAAGRNYRWLDDIEGRLALIIALDQLPRNLFRGSPRAFAYDHATAALCLAAAATGQDHELLPIQRVFLYMPLQHAEDLQAQTAGVKLYQGLAEDACDWPEYEEVFLPFAKLHYDIIRRFGRFPHRNAVLGRENTPEEAEYLAGDAPTFGQ